MPPESLGSFRELRRSCGEATGDLVHRIHSKVKGIVDTMISRFSYKVMVGHRIEQLAMVGIDSRGHSASRMSPST